MMPSDMATSNAPHQTNSQPVFVEDPFASPASQAIDTPRYPEACAQLPPKTSTGPTYTGGPLAATEQNNTATTSHKSASMSSAGTTMSSFDLEKGMAKEQDKQNRRSKRDSARDPEKAFYSAQTPTPARSHRSPRHSHRPSRDGGAASVIYSDAESEIDEGLAIQEAKAMKILFFLSGPVIALSFLNLIWTLISLVIQTTLYTKHTPFIHPRSGEIVYLGTIYVVQWEARTPGFVGLTLYRETITAENKTAEVMICCEYTYIYVYIRPLCARRLVNELRASPRFWGL